MAKWRYVLEEELYFFHPSLVGVVFRNEWLLIEHSRMLIRKNYAWDGCSPSIRLPSFGLFPNGIWLGIWDGPLNKNGRPVTWKATLIHDAMCQFRQEIPGLSKDATVRIFWDNLVKEGAPTWMVKLYSLAIETFGPQRWLKK